MSTRLIAVGVLALSFLPVANLIPEGSADAEYLARLLDWAYGLSLCVGIGGLAAYVIRVRSRQAPVSSERGPRVPLPPGGNPGSGFVPLVALLAGVLYLVVAKFVFSGRPLLIDEIVQVMQARWYSEGHLSVPTPPLPEFFSILHLVDVGERTYGQFPAGGPAMLALGSALQAEWIVGPAVGAASVALFASLLRHLEPEASRRWHRWAILLFAVTPFGVFMFGSHMNHATALMWLLAATVALAHATAREDAPPSWGLAVGLALGAAATIRPLDAAAFALPAAAWLAWRAHAGARARALFLMSGVGVAIPMCALFWVNLRTTGDPFRFGYDLLWGEGHGLGFHRSPWGPVHTPLRGVELAGLYFTRLSEYLFETPFPALIPAAIALWFARPLRPLDRYLLVSAGLVVVGYWAYWHDGFYLGPRFMLPLLPTLVLWSARFLPAVDARLGDRLAGRLGVRVALGAGASYALAFLLLVRVPQYRNGMTSMRIDIAQESARAGVHGALVLVKESWGAQLVVRLWRLGLSRSDTEILYRTADACKLEVALDELDRTAVRGAGARDRLMSLRADSAALIKSTRSPDFTERMLPGHVYAAICEDRLRDDEGGFSHLAPLRLAKDGNVYARWLPGRERDVAQLYPGRPVFILGREGSGVESPLTWTPWTP